MDGKITGTLFKQTTGSLVDTWGEGYFMALKFTSSNWNKYSSVKVGLDPSQGSGLVEILNDPDKNGAFKVTSPSEQTFKVVATGKNGETLTQEFGLSDLIGKMFEDNEWVTDPDFI